MTRKLMWERVVGGLASRPGRWTTPLRKPSGGYFPTGDNGSFLRQRAVFTARQITTGAWRLSRTGRRIERAAAHYIEGRFQREWALKESQARALDRLVKRGRS